MSKAIFLILDLLGIVVISLLSFGIFPITDGFILSYIFLIVSALLQLVPIFLSQKAKDTAYRASLYTVSGMYFIIQLVVSILGYTLLNSSLQLILTMGLMLLILDIAASLIVVQIGINGDNTKQREDAKTFFIDKAIFALEKIKGQVKENEITAMIDEVIQKARFNNLNSPAEAEETETKIIEEIENLEKLISASKTRECKTSCEKLILLFSERDMLCKLYK